MTAAPRSGRKALYVKGDYTVAIEVLRDACRSAADAGYPHLMLSCRLWMGNCYSDLGRMEEMLTHYSVAERLAEALRDTGSLSALRYNVASTQLELGQPEKALSYFASLPRPGFLDLHKLAICHEQLGHREQALAAVQQAEGRSPGPMLEVFTGGATFYSDSFHGKKTANGERYNKNEFTAAHRSLPLGTIVRVTNLSNGNNLLVRINDRGPGKKKLILDVSRAAASKLNMIRRGVISVQVEVVADKRGIPVLRNNAFYLRLASARTLKDAQNKLKTLSSASSSKLTKQTSRNRSGELKILSERLPNGRTQYFVGQGPFTRYRDAQHALSKARARHTEASVTCLPTLVAENTR